MIKRTTPPPDLADALHEMYPDGAMFSVDENDVIEWYEDNIHPQPADADVHAKLAEMTEAWKKEVEYQNLRVGDYPEYHEQLDMIFHLGIDGWREKIQEIKDRYPKPE